MQISMNMINNSNNRSTAKNINFGSFTEHDKNLMANLEQTINLRILELQKELETNPISDMSSRLNELQRLISNKEDSMDYAYKWKDDINGMLNKLTSFREQAKTKKAEYEAEQKRLAEQRRLEEERKYRQGLADEVIAKYDMQDAVNKELAAFLMKLTLRVQVASEHKPEEFFGTDEQAAEARKNLSPECQKTSKELREEINSLDSIHDPIKVLIAANQMKNFGVKKGLLQETQQKEMVDRVKSTLSSIIRNADLSGFAPQDKNEILLMVQQIEKSDDFNFGIGARLKALIDKLNKKGCNTLKQEAQNYATASNNGQPIAFRGMDLVHKRNSVSFGARQYNPEATEKLATVLNENRMELEPEFFINKIERAINQGADPNVTNERGWNALHKLVCYYDEPKTVEFLVNAGVKINAANNLGRTAVLIAANENHPQSAEKLLELGADPFIKDDGDGDAFDAATFDFREMYRDFRRRTSYDSIIRW